MSYITSSAREWIERLRNPKSTAFDPMFVAALFETWDRAKAAPNLGKFLGGEITSTDDEYERRFKQLLRDKYPNEKLRYVTACIKPSNTHRLIVIYSNKSSGSPHHLFAPGLITFNAISSPDSPHLMLHKDW